MKKTQFDPLRLDLSQLIYSVLENHLESEFQKNGATIPSPEELSAHIVEAPSLELGHFAFGSFLFAKILKKAPNQVAGHLAGWITLLPEDLKNTHGIQSCQAVGPYVNFFMQPEYLAKVLIPDVINSTMFTRPLVLDPEKTMIEYSQPNTHKELHVGHMRNACLGDSLVKLLRYAGVPVLSSTFPGDVGAHVAKCLWYFKYHNQDPVPTQHRGEWLGSLYSRAHLKLEDEEKTPLYEKNRAQLTEILKELESKSGEFYDLWKETRQWSIGLMQELYDWSDISFDHWYWESDVDSASAVWVKELYQAGKLVESQGAIGMDLSDKKLGFCLLLKTDGNGLYATKDLELARRKFQDYAIEKNIYVVDMRQALHFQQVFEVLDRLGFPQAKKCFHLQYNFVELPDGAMSSRKGNIVPIMHLVKNMQNHVMTEYLDRYKDEWSEEERTRTAGIVARGAIKFGMLVMDPNKKIVFDMKEWLRLDGESGPYIQYACARIQSLIRKFGSDLNKEVTRQTSFAKLGAPSEISLLLKLWQFNSVIFQSVDNYKPSLLCNYLYELAKRFSSFYAECPIGTAEDAEIRTQRLLLARAVAETLKQGLGLLGIPVPERM